MAREPKVTTFRGILNLEYWKGLESSSASHGTTAAPQQTVTSTDNQPYVHQFSAYQRPKLTQAEIDMVDLGLNEVRDWKKVKAINIKLEE